MSEQTITDLSAVANGNVDDVPADRLYSLASKGLLDFDEVPGSGAVFTLSDRGRDLIASSTP